MCKYMSVKTDTIYRVDLPHIVGWIFLTQYLKTYSLLFTTSNILTKWEKVVSDQTISSIWDLAGNARDLIFYKRNVKLFQFQQWLSVYFYFVLLSVTINTSQIIIFEKLISFKFSVCFEYIYQKNFVVTKDSIFD